ncbi:hypothetical protein B0J18DRAFT_343970, partial [Chaetomium sp. MPI-SDFR-AT-0129]
MAQSPEVGLLRRPSSLDSAPIQPRVHPNLDALLEQKPHPNHHHENLHPHSHPHSRQEPLNQQPTRQDLHQHEHQPRYQLPQYSYQHQHEQHPQYHHPPGALHPADALSKNDNNTNGGRSPGGGDEVTNAHSVVSANGSTNDNASSGARPPYDGRGNNTQHGDTNGAPAPTLASAPAPAPAPTPAPGHPEMSSSQPGPGPGRQSVAYASPQPYPPPGIPPVSQYMYSAQHIPSDPYRSSPTTLPSMRTLDHRQPQAPPQHGVPLGPHMGGPTMPPPTPAHHMGYYGIHAPHMYGLPDPNAMRFALAPGMAHDPRISLSGGRHKKEIKRRTKTGCLTCRKRRIKCDEAHPTCNNCKKSKRECLGYDPIFKQQQGPAAIQPAPSTPSASSVAAHQPTAASNPALSSSAPPHPSYPMSSYIPPPVPSTIAPESPVASASQTIKTEPSYDYSTAIDPALQAPDAANAPGPRLPRYHPAGTSVSAGQG